MGRCQLVIHLSLSLLLSHLENLTRTMPGSCGMAQVMSMASMTGWLAA